MPVMRSTKLLSIDAESPDASVIAEAADVLRAGGLVAFPTETVYGLGGNALDAHAVAGIFKAKGRPAGNPLIVHIPNVQAAHTLTDEWPDYAVRLAERFWPGPLTLVVKKNTVVPDIVTAGGPTVALRVPKHKVALALLEASGIPIAAPSANRSSRLSPTSAEHVHRDLHDRIHMILDAGVTPGGLESTVLDMTVSPPRLLRPGLVSAAEIETVVGLVERPHIAVADAPEPLRSPGLLERHYSPRTRIECVAGCGRARVEELARGGSRVGWLSLDEGGVELPGVQRRIMPVEPADYAAQLYGTLHKLDNTGLDCIIVELPPLTEEWLAVHDRLGRM